MKVAAAQFQPIFKEVAHNLHMATQLVQEAAQAGAQLIVLPELAITGYSFMSAAEAEVYAEVVQEKQGSIGAMLSLAQRLDVAIAWGFIERSPSGSLHNSQALVLPDGTLVFYAKVNQWANDFLWAEPGSSSPPIIDYLGQKIGLLICRDVRDKSSDLEEFYEPEDADIVAFSANWGDGGYPSVSWMKFATTNKTWLVVGNRYGREANNNFGEGGPCIVCPEGHVHCEGLVWSQPCIVYADTAL